MRFRHTAKFAVSPSNLKNLTASPGVERARKPSGYFFGTFFVQAKKVHTVPHTHGSREGEHTLRVLFWYFFRTSEKSTYRVPPPWESRRCAHPLRTFLAPFSCERKKCGRQSAARRKLQRRFAVGEKGRKGLDTCLVSQAKEFIWIFQRYFLRKKF